MTIEQLVEQSHAIAVRKGWWNGARPPLELLMLIVTELAEAAESFRNGEHSVRIDQATGKPEGWGVELADAVLRIADMAGHYGIDLEDIIQKKMHYNNLRPTRHGGKKY